MTPSPLTAAEVLVLRDSLNAKGWEALKLALSELIARKALGVRVDKSMFRGTRIYIWPNRELAKKLPSGAVLKTVLDLVIKANGLNSEIPMADLVKEVGRQYGRDVSRFKKDVVLPELVSKGFLEPHEEKILWVFPVTRHRPSQRGQQKIDELEMQMTRANEIPELVKSNPAEATALLAALGGAALLVDGVKKHRAEIASVLGSHSSQGSHVDILPIYFEQNPADDISMHHSSGMSFDEFDSSIGFDGGGFDGGGFDGGGGDGGGGGGGD